MVVATEGACLQAPMPSARALRLHQGLFTLHTPPWDPLPPIMHIAHPKAKPQGESSSPRKPHLLHVLHTNAQSLVEAPLAVLAADVEHNVLGEHGVGDDVHLRRTNAGAQDWSVPPPCVGMSVLLHHLTLLLHPQLLTTLAAGSLCVV